MTLRPSAYMTPLLAASFYLELPLLNFPAKKLNKSVPPGYLSRTITVVDIDPFQFD